MYLLNTMHLLYLAYMSNCYKMLESDETVFAIVCSVNHIKVVLFAFFSFPCSNIELNVQAKRNNISHNRHCN
jgi:hypothetical protein